MSDALIERLATREKATPELLAEVDAFARKSRASWPVLELLSELPPDPRVAVVALGLLRDWATLKHTSAKLWRRLADTVEAHGDASASAALAKVKLPAKASEALAARRDNVVAKLAKGVARKAKRAAKAKPAGDLLAAIQADPSDLAARAVYADALGAAGDPRGEFITLQLLGKAPERQAELLAEHWRAWIGPLAAYAETLDGFVFENGFLAVVPAVDVPKHRGLVFADPIWATVHTAWRATGFSPAMRALRIAGTTEAALPQLDRLEHRLDRLDLGMLQHAKSLASARDVRDVRIDATPGIAWEALHVVGDGNDVLESFEARGMWTAAWVEGKLAPQLAGLGDNLVWLRFAWSYGDIVLEREPGGAWDRATVKQLNRTSTLSDLHIAVEPFAAMRLDKLHVITQLGYTFGDDSPVRAAAREVTTATFRR